MTEISTAAVRIVGRVADRSAALAFVTDGNREVRVMWRETSHAPIPWHYHCDEHGRHPQPHCAHTRAAHGAFTDRREQEMAQAACQTDQAHRHDTDPWGVTPNEASRSTACEPSPVSARFKRFHMFTSPTGR